MVPNDAIQSPAPGSEFLLPEAISPAPKAAPVWHRAFRQASAWLSSVVAQFTLPEEEASVDLFGKLIATTPPWLISLIVHFGIMIALGLAVFGASHTIKSERLIEVELAAPAPEPKEIYAETLGEQLEDPSQKFSHNGPEPFDGGVASIPARDLPVVDDPLIGPPVLNMSPEGTLPAGTVVTPNIGLELSGRQEGIKNSLLKAYGGTALTEEAVKEGLRWLARQQRSRGSWSLRGPYRDGANDENEQAATAMALLAFQGAGYTPEGPKTESFTRVTARGWRFLLRGQQKDGRFFENLTREQHQLYTQAMCTIAICELYGMTRDEEYREPAQKAIDYCVKIQTPEGGWRYQPGTDSDLSVTGWFAMALQSARMAGIEVPSPAFDGISKFLDSVQREDGSRYAYRPLDGATLPLTAEGLLSRQYLGWKHDDPRLRAGVDFLLANLPAWDKRNVYYWYYATQVCHHMEGADWRAWNEVTRQLLPEHQEKRGAERGSWDPSGDRWGDSGGRLYVTCLSLYVLEIYYRHLPIYQSGLLDR
jgi:hypothetical protein